jgi:hypothetical protein
VPEGVELEHADRAVPDDRSRRLQQRRQRIGALRPDVEDELVGADLGDALRRRRRVGLELRQRLDLFDHRKSLDHNVVGAVVETVVLYHSLTLEVSSFSCDIIHKLFFLQVRLELINLISLVSAVFRYFFIDRLYMLRNLRTEVGKVQVTKPDCKTE